MDGTPEAGSGGENAGEGEDSVGETMEGSRRRGGGRSMPVCGGVRHGAPASNCRGTGAGERGETRPGLPHHVAELRW